MKLKKFTLNIPVVVFIVMSVMPTCLWAGEAGNLVKQTLDNGLNVLKEPALAGKEKTQERRKKLWEKIGFIFNMEEMAKRSLGRYWKDRTSDERKEFVELFTELTKNTYLEKTDTYSGEKIIFIGERQDEEYSKVQTTFITKTGKEISVDFSLLSNNEKWQIYDIIIEGVSLVNNYRSQFNNILLKSPYKILVKKMREKAPLKD